MSIAMRKIGKRFMAGLLAVLLTISCAPAEMASAAEATDAGVAEAPHVITGFVGLNDSQAKVMVNGKLEEDLLTASMPASLEVYLDGSSETVSIPVTWNCVGDYRGTNFYYYEFDPQWDNTQYSASAKVLKSMPYIGVSINRNSSLKMSSVSSNEKIIYDFMKDELGLNTAAACGALANIQAESSFNPTASIIDTNDKRSFGICQWNGPRDEALQAYCARNGYNYKTLTGQLNYLKYEFQTTEKSAFSKIKNVENTKQGAYDAGYNWARYFERCASDYYEQRAKLARDTYWARYGNDTDEPDDPVDDGEEYAINYYLYEGINSSSNPESFYATTSNIKLESPTKEGYTFAGWYKESSFKNKITVIKKGTKKDVSLYAKWNVNKYTIQFKGNKSTSGSTKVMKSIEYDSSYTLKSNGFKRKGYKFKCWNTKSNGTGISYVNKEEIENLTTKDGETITLYAQWIKQKYNITYKTNGGKIPSGSPKMYDVNSKTYKLKNSTRKGYTFKGWYTDKKFKKRITNIKKGSTGNLTLYAKWSTNNYVLKFDGNGATSGTMNKNISCKYGKAYDLLTNKFKRTDYVFEGWNTKADGSGVFYQNKEEVKNLSSKNQKNVTLYAQWSKKEYSISYELNGGTVVVSNPQSYYADTKTFKLNNPQREGYTFKGWYTENSFQNKITKIKKGAKKNYELYAKWEINSYTLQFNGNGATEGVMNNLTPCQYGTIYTLPANTFLRPGYRFIGWSTGADGSNTFYGNQAAVQNLTTANGATVTLYAQWELTTAN